MTRLIDADKLYPDCLTKNGRVAISATQIASAPTVEERPQGEWIRQPSSKTIFFCSECGREINTSPFTRTDNFPFCHCGADMRGEE